MIQDLEKEDAKKNDGSFTIKPCRIGKTILICGRRDSVFPFQCLVGPDWHCMLVTFALIIGVPIVFMFYVAFKLHVLVGIFGALLSASLIICYSMAACSDPGIVFVSEIKSDESKDDLVECGRCNILRPKNASHCYDCEVCIKDLDHHCPWTGKCIGQRNMRFFTCFVALVCMNIMYVVVATIVWLTYARPQTPD